MMYKGASMMIGQPMDIALELSKMMGKGFFMGGMPQGVAAFVAHVAYGAVLGVVAGKGVSSGRIVQ